MLRAVPSCLGDLLPPGLDASFGKEERGSSVIFVCYGLYLVVSKIGVLTSNWYWDNAWRPSGADLFGLVHTWSGGRG